MAEISRTNKPDNEQALRKAPGKETQEEAHVVRSAQDRYARPMREERAYSKEAWRTPPERASARYCSCIFHCLPTGSHSEPDRSAFRDCGPFAVNECQPARFMPHDPGSRAR